MIYYSVMGRSWKPSTSKSKLKGQLGQATTEYVLMLVISVSLVLLLMYQVFTPMQRFLDAYMGLYVQCLLEYGELPSFGGDSVVKDDGDCNAQFESFSGTNGRPPKPGTGGSGGGANNADQDGNASSDGSSTNSNTTNSRYSAGSGTSYAGSASRNGGRYIRNSRGASRGLDTGTSGGPTVEIALDGGGSGGYFSSNSPRFEGRVVRKTSSISAEQLPESVRRKIAKDKSGGKTAMVAVESEGGGPAKPKSFVIKPPEKKMQIEEDKTEFSIGNTLRIIFIVCILLVIFIFVGGQVLQMSKSSKE